jgi:hypothetical protein
MLPSGGAGRAVSAAVLRGAFIGRTAIQDVVDLFCDVPYAVLLFLPFWPRHSSAFMNVSNLPPTNP